MANLIYNSAKTGLLNGTLDLDTDDIKMMLVTSAYTPLASHANKSDVTNEVSGAGYTAGGQSLTNKTVTLVGAEGRFDADPVVWAASSITARAAVLYKDTGVAGTSTLLAYLDFVSDFTSVAADFTVNPNAAGILGLNEA